MSTSYSICPECFAINRLPLEDPPGKSPVCGKCQSKLHYQGGISELSATQLQKFVEKAPVPLLVDFWAPWCGPCRAFAPTFQQAAKEWAGKIIFAKVNTEEHTLASSAFRIQGIPSLIYFSKGLEKDRISGALPPPQLNQWLRAQF